MVCCNKAIDQYRVAESLKSVIDHGTTIVVLQNGVGNEDPFRDLFPENTIISGVVSAS